ncbi:PREDICTED: uncharacterized protein LOC107095508 [Cyprinodon variegatus]|uniref:uncharacterized protein LOC107095508 n=1 Tax=Cyprinodon variegatus TaxID=28743 RepID=UPI0007428768|nr:PREDICTED: uncharacterized protein LOC107095508 [Cyprinodon variegatus]
MSLSVPQKYCSKRWSPTTKCKRLSSPRNGSDKRCSPPRANDDKQLSPTRSCERWRSPKTDDKQGMPQKNHRPQSLPRRDEEQSLPKKGDEEISLVIRKRKRSASLEEELYSQKKKSGSIQILKKQLLDDSAVQSLSRQSNIEEVVNLVVPALLAKLAENEDSSTKSSLPSQDKKVRKVLKKLSSRSTSSSSSKQAKSSIRPKDVTSKKVLYKTTETLKKHCKMKSGATKELGFCENLDNLPIKKLLSLHQKLVRKAKQLSYKGKTTFRSKAYSVEKQTLKSVVFKTEPLQPSGKNRIQEKLPHTGQSNHKPRLVSRKNQDLEATVREKPRVKGVARIIVVESKNGKRLVKKVKANASNPSAEKYSGHSRSKVEDSLGEKWHVSNSTQPDPKETKPLFNSKLVMTSHQPQIEETVIKMEETFVKASPKVQPGKVSDSKKSKSLQSTTRKKTFKEIKDSQVVVKGTTKVGKQLQKTVTISNKKILTKAKMNGSKTVLPKNLDKTFRCSEVAKQIKIEDSWGDQWPISNTSQSGHKETKPLDSKVKATSDTPPAKELIVKTQDISVKALPHIGPRTGPNPLSQKSKSPEKNLDFDEILEKPVSDENIGKERLPESTVRVSKTSASTLPVTETCLDESETSKSGMQHRCNTHGSQSLSSKEKEETSSQIINASLELTLQENLPEGYGSLEKANSKIKVEGPSVIMEDNVHTVKANDLAVEISKQTEPNVKEIKKNYKAQSGNIAADVPTSIPVLETKTNEATGTNASSGDGAQRVTIPDKLIDSTQTQQMTVPTPRTSVKAGSQVQAKTVTNPDFADLNSTNGKQLQEQIKSSGSSVDASVVALQEIGWQEKNMALTDAGMSQTQKNQPLNPVCTIPVLVSKASSPIISTNCKKPETPNHFDSLTVGERIANYLNITSFDCVPATSILSSQACILDSTLLLITNLPMHQHSSYKEKELADLLCKFKFQYLANNIYVIPQTGMAFALMPNEPSARCIIWVSERNKLHLQQQRLFFHIMKNNILLSPLVFYKSLMEPTPLVTPKLPLKALPDSREILTGVEIPNAKCGIPPGTTAPFWVTMTTVPYVFPTVCPWFNIPNFLTVKGEEDILMTPHPGSEFFTVMLTGLPETCYKHEDIAKLVWPYFPIQNLRTLYYNILVLPLQRRMRTQVIVLVKNQLNHPN